MGRLAKILVGIVGIVVLLLVGLTLLLQSGAVSNRVKDLVVPRVSAALGRELTVAGAKLSIFPSPRVALRGAKLAGRPNEPALAEMESLDVGVAFWPLATSLGKDVRVTHIALVKPVLNLVRAKDGTWNYEGLGGEAKTPPPQDPNAQKTKVVVDKATIQDGTVRYIDQQTGADARVALQKIDLDASNVGLGQPLDAKLSAAIASEEKNFEAQVHASKLPESAADLGPGKYPELTGTIALKGLDLAKFRAFFPSKVTRIMTGGRVDADAKLVTQDQKYVVDGGGKLSQVRLRGDPAQGGFKLHATADPASGAAQAKLSDIALKGPGVDLTGTATVDTKPQRVRFAFQGSTLDLAQVMALAPQEQQPEKPKGAPLLTAEQRKEVEALDVQGTVALQKVVRGAFAADDFKADLALDQGAFLIRQGSAKFFGGNVDAAGTRFDLSQALPTWNLKAKLEGVDLGKALAAFSGVAAVTGTTTGALDLNGAGVDWNALKKALTGKGALALKDGALTTADLGSSVLGAVSKGLQAAGKGNLAQKLTDDGKTSLKDLAASFTVEDGALKLAKALSFNAPFGAAQLGGKIGLGGELGLDGTATVSKEALSQVAGGSKIPLPSGLQVPLALGGTLSQPSVSVKADEAVTNLVSGAAKAKAAELQKDVTRRAQDEAKKGVGDILKGFGVGGH
ncbi:MAG TPA: AsmA family protein [Anaeromyxobacteraceae bacterium]|nr:AsmA family protein [Anaeromyxobacteraceae bacterium]